MKLRSSIARLSHVVLVVALAVMGWACGEAPFVNNNEGAYCVDTPACIADVTYIPGAECIDHGCFCPPDKPRCRHNTWHDPDGEGWGCWPPNECLKEDGSTSASSSSGASSSGEASSSSSGPEPVWECSAPETCPPPPDIRCGRATCEEHLCGFDFEPSGALASQIAGDCKTSFCNGFGGVVDVEDPSDVYNDGKQCTFDVCMGGQPVAIPFTEGLMCPESGSGYCHDTECVQCINTILVTYCDGLLCSGTLCVKPHCDNTAVDANETDLDCGGECAPCPTNKGCLVNSDCQDGVCAVNKLCAPPGPDDGVKNDGETDVDCGGTQSNAKCDDGMSCALYTDCKSGVCWAGKCEPPSCFDGIMNGVETTPDCGGGCDGGCH